MDVFHFSSSRGLSKVLAWKRDWVEGARPRKATGPPPLVQKIRSDTLARGLSFLMVSVAVLKCFSIIVRYPLPYSLGFISQPPLRFDSILRSGVSIGGVDRPSARSLSMNTSRAVERSFANGCCAFFCFLPILSLQMFVASE